MISGHYLLAFTHYLEPHKISSLRKVITSALLLPFDEIYEFLRDVSKHLNEERVLCSKTFIYEANSFRK